MRVNCESREGREISRHPNFATHSEPTDPEILWSPQPGCSKSYSKTPQSLWSWLVPHGASVIIAIFSKKHQNLQILPTSVYVAGNILRCQPETWVPGYNGGPRGPLRNESHRYLMIFKAGLCLKARSRLNLVSCGCSSSLRVAVWCMFVWFILIIIQHRHMSTMACSVCRHTL